MLADEFESSLPSFFVTEIVTATVTPMTASNATAPNAHFQPLPRFFGGGPTDHCCRGHGGCCGG
ncbi:hypothetical protein A5776_22270 [Mycolicibacterium elephantis]|nr:hypothetical protein A5762_14385 [Mycolicibacterium elephantis]OBE94662.1 hypothetical protein A5776_22270 [Mycolicibacterium elephantis]